MIYLAGDIHGALEVEKVTKFFESEVLQRKLSGEDYLILLGDVGLCWDGGEKDAFVREKLERLPVTVLWIDGNHENFDLVDSLSVSNWHGGRVQFIGTKIIHLMRGYVYDICGKSIFAFGGGHSIDKMWRTEGVSWWAREMPSEEELERGRENLRAHGNKVDYIVTHTLPGRVARKLEPHILPGEEVLQDYLQEIVMNTEFTHWYFGHWHIDCKLDEFTGLYDEVAVITV